MFDTARFPPEMSGNFDPAVNPISDMTESERDAVFSDLRSSSILATRPPNAPNDNRKRSKAFVYHSAGYVA